MHQFASAVLSGVLSPFNWLIVLLLVACMVKKRSLKKTALILALFVFIVFGNAALLNWYAKTWQPKPVVLSPSAEYSCGIVPGGFASPDADANGYFNATADRFIQAVKLYKTGHIKHILISGGNGKENEKSFREAAWVRGELVSVGIPDSVIFTEDKSNNTKENAIYSKQILDSLHLTPPYLLITSAFHMPRAALVFKKAGVDVVPFPCNYNIGRGSFSPWDLIPTPSTLLGWDSFLKETVGYWWYKIR
jgi:uncharacterized SAM-binding protein YcdF (DUF218 family)